ncbi:hypothetical protein AWZ03_014344, partial [Drosophila navojoa]
LLSPCSSSSDRDNISVNNSNKSNNSKSNMPKTCLYKDDELLR